MSALPVILLFFLGAFGIGYLTGGKSRNARIILSVGTGLRNPTVSILVATRVGKKTIRARVYRSSF